MRPWIGAEIRTDHISAFNQQHTGLLRGIRIAVDANAIAHFGRQFDARESSAYDHER